MAERRPDLLSYALQDIVIAAALFYPMKLVLDAVSERRAPRAQERPPVTPVALLAAPRPLAAAIPRGVPLRHAVVPDPRQPAPVCGSAGGGPAGDDGDPSGRQLQDCQHRRACARGCSCCPCSGGKGSQGGEGSQGREGPQGREAQG